jgi:guanylate kinase
MNNTSLLIVISGPSGVGKDTVISKIKQLTHSIHHTVTATTRPKRKGEVDGIDYSFISENEFDQIIKRDGFLEWATGYGNLYGTPRAQIRQALEQGMDVIAKVDVQGAISIKKVVPEALFIWISAPSIDQLAERLRQRNSDSDEDINVRIDTVHQEVKSLHVFDYEVINEQGKANLAASEIVDIITAEKNREKPRQIEM